MDGQQGEPLEAAVTPVAPDGSVVALRPAESRRVCSSCRVSNSTSDVYCTGCGLPLAAPVGMAVRHGDGPLVDGVVVEGGAAEEPQAELVDLARLDVALPVPPQQRADRASRRWPLALVGLLSIAAVAGTIVFAVLWRSQTQHVERVQAQLEATRNDLSSTRASLAETRANLSAANSLAERRRAVLVRTRDVLTKVDPLFSSVDAIQHQARGIQSAGDTITSDADQLVSSLATATNYLANTDSAYVDVAYYNSMIDAANSSFALLQADESALANSESSYQSASTKFGNHADAFSAAVRKLQQQLKRVAGK